MKRHLTQSWIHVAAGAAIVVGSTAPQHAMAQYAGYPSTTQPAVPQAVSQPYAGATAQPAYAPYRPQSTAPTRPTVAVQYPSTAYPQVVAYPQAAAVYPQQTVAYPRVASAYPQTTNQYPQYPGYPSVAQQPVEAMPPQETETLPAPVAPGDPAPVNDGMSSDGAVNGSPNGAVMHNGPAESLPADSGYPQTGYPNGTAGCADGAYGSTSAGCYSDYGVSGYFNGHGSGTQWFGGVYGLYMTRDDGEFRRLTAQFDTPAGGYPYYPTADVTVLSTENVDHDYREGVEIRFGSTLSTGSWMHDDCNGYGYGYGTGCDTSCATNDFAWEVGYWILDDDLNTDQIVDAIPTDTDRMYGMKNFAGLEYNGEPVNLWYDYQVPVEDPTGAPPWGSGVLVRVLAQRVRSNFQAQNLELNLLRLPVYCGSSCGNGSCNSGCESYGADCAPACGTPFSIMTLCGVRYTRLDDDFQYATMWAIDDGTGTLTPPAYTPWDGDGELYYDVNVDNQLVGFQLGANMNYCVSCNCNLFWNSSFGLYNNHISSYQRVYGALGNATWVGSGEDAAVRSNKDDVAFMGEMMLGGSYDFTCNWRGVLAYRAIAISGVALSTDQIPEDFSNEAQVALIDSNGSLIIHGVQAGVECRY
jgi:hypothetical protein